MANKTRNFQSGTSGREKGSLTYTSKVRGKNGTKAINVRCGGKDDRSKVCAVAKELYANSVHRMAEFPSDEEERQREGRPKRKRKSHKGE